MEWFERQFPNAVGKYAQTSKRNKFYNCIGWAATGRDDEWWQHGPGYKWPAKNRSPLVSSLVAVFVAIGYEERPATDTAFEPEYDKVAIYAKRGMWTHASRQKSNGKWTSKLGPDEDIEHDNPECLCGDSYGVVHCIMRKARK